MKITLDQVNMILGTEQKICFKYTLNYDILCMSHILMPPKLMTNDALEISN